MKKIKKIRASKGNVLIQMGAIILICCVCVLLATWTSSVLAIFVGVTLAIVSSIFVVGFYSDGVLILPYIFIVAFAAIFCIVFGCEYALLGPTISEISVTAAPEHPMASIYHFNDGHLELRFEGQVAVYSGSRGRRSLAYYQHVVPVVPEGWSSSQPIPLWAASVPYKYRASRQSWEQTYRSGIRLVDDGECLEAIKDLESRHHLISAPHAPVIVWTASPETIRDRQLERLVEIVAVACFAWAVVIGYDKIRKKPPMDNLEKASSKGIQ